MNITRWMAACCVLLAAGAAAAQAYPAKAVRILAGQAPGGATDFLARVIAQKLNEAWKQPVVVENRPGAAGAIAAELTARAAPDGHTLLLSTAGMIVINPYLSKLAYDPLKDLARRREYFEWAKLVVDRLRGVHPELEKRFDEAYAVKP